MAPLEHSRALLVDAFERVHEQVPDVVEGLEHPGLTYRPEGGGNPIGWLVWHLARVQDDHVAELAGVEQAWHVGGWHGRLGLPVAEDDTGYGHTSHQVDEVAARVWSGQLAEYHEAVHALTVRYLDGLTAAELDRIVDERWDPPVTASARLVSVIGDITAHVGQAQYVRGLWERRG